MKTIKGTNQPREWRDELVNYLIAAGTTGRNQNEIGVRFKQARAAEIEHELEGLMAQDKAQLFLVPPQNGRNGRRAKVWRATTKILKME